MFTVDGRYTARGWTEWTQGFQYGSALLQFDATGDERFLELGRERTRDRDGRHVTHVGVHDHGFNNVSTYGNLWRLLREGRIDADAGATSTSSRSRSAAPCRRPAGGTTADGTGYIYSFNGPQSLFVDTIRSCRALAVAHQLGHALMGEHDERISLLGRLVEHAANTARYNVFYGEGRDAYDVRGPHRPRGALQHQRRPLPLPQHPAGLLAVHHLDPRPGLGHARLRRAAGIPRPPSTDDEDLDAYGGQGRGRDDAAPRGRRRPATSISSTRRPTASPTGTPARPAWRSSATTWTGRPTRSTTTSRSTAPPPRSPRRACCASAATWARRAPGRRYWQAGLTVLDTLLDEPYLCTDPAHQGLLLHSVYHRPNGWDHVAAGPAGALRRIQHVGRLPRPRGRPYVQRVAARRAVLHVLRRALVERARASEPDGT